MSSLSPVIRFFSVKNFKLIEDSLKINPILNLEDLQNDLFSNSHHLISLSKCQTNEFVYLFIPYDLHMVFHLVIESFDIIGILFYYRVSHSVWLFFFSLKRRFWLQNLPQHTKMDQFVWNLMFLLIWLQLTQYRIVAQTKLLFNE